MQNPNPERQDHHRKGSAAMDPKVGGALYIDED